MIANILSFKKSKQVKGFTIIELIVVLVIIGLMATISVVSYGSWRQNLDSVNIKNDLFNLSTAMNSARNFDSEYPDSVPSNFVATEGIILSGGSYDDGNSFCISGYNEADPTNIYHIDSSDGDDAVAVAGDCQAVSKTWLALDSNGVHTCAIYKDNQVYCWGKNDYGQLGDGTTNNSINPVAVDTTGVLNGKSIKSVYTNLYHSCAIASDDRVYCWGRNFGRLGNDDVADSSVPVAVDVSGVLSGKAVVKVALGNYFSCAITTEGRAYCWGMNNNGNLGTGDYTNTIVPVAVSTSGLLSGKFIIDISAGYYGHACVVDSIGDAFCWGDNSSGGRLGNGSEYIALLPVAVDKTGVLAGKQLKSISAGTVSTCAVSTDGLGYCWGNGGYGRLGNNSSVNSPYPVEVIMDGALAGKTLKQISAASSHTCALASDNQVYCWGHNAEGQCGYGNTTDSRVPLKVLPTGVLNGKTIEYALSSAYGHSYAISDEGDVYSWGYNAYGILGDSTTDQRNSPVLMSVTP